MKERQYGRKCKRRECWSLSTRAWASLDLETKGEGKTAKFGCEEGGEGKKGLGLSTVQRTILLGLGTVQRMILVF